MTAALPFTEAAMSEQRLNRPVSDDEPLRLDVAARIAYPDGSIDGAALQRQARKGKLVVERVAGKDFTTLAEIKAMRERCRVERKVPVSGSDLQDVTIAGASLTPQQFSSSMQAAKSALDALTSATPKARSPRTLRKSTRGR